MSDDDSIEIDDNARALVPSGRSLQLRNQDLPNLDTSISPEFEESTVQPQFQPSSTPVPNTDEENQSSKKSKNRTAPYNKPNSTSNKITPTTTQTVQTTNEILRSRQQTETTVATLTKELQVLIKSRTVGRPSTKIRKNYYYRQV